MKYCVDVGSFCTRMVTRKIIVNAISEEEAKQKAIEKFISIEMKLPSSNDPGDPQVDFIEVIK